MELKAQALFPSVVWSTLLMTTQRSTMSYSRAPMSSAIEIHVGSVEQILPDGRAITLFSSYLNLRLSIAAYYRPASALPNLNTLFRDSLLIIKLG